MERRFSSSFIRLELYGNLQAEIQDEQRNSLLHTTQHPFVELTPLRHADGHHLRHIQGGGGREPKGASRFRGNIPQHTSC